MAITPPTYTPSGSLFGTTTTTTAPYTYGNLGNNTSSYNIWGSKGNPYLIAGPTYTPGSGAPILPQPIAPISPTQGGDDSPVPDWVYPTDGDSSNGFRDPFNATPFNSKVFGQLYPGLGLTAGLVHGRIDAPFGEGYARLPWYEGSAGGGYGYTEEGYDQYAPGDTDRGIYSSYYNADGNLVTERDWDDSFDDYNTDDRWAQTGLWEGLGNWLGGRTWDGLEQPATFADPASKVAVEARENVATGMNKAERVEAARVAEQQRQAQARAQAKAQAQAAQEDTVRAAQRAETARVRREIYGDDGGGSPPSSPPALDPFGPGVTDEEASDDSGSYIDTATTQALGEEGLSVFNNWRDYMSTWHPTFKTSYGRYRVTAPKIVAEIDKQDNSKDLYREIWDKHLKPIYGMIKQDMNDEKALVDYKVMVKELMNKYLKGDK